MTRPCEVDERPGIGHDDHATPSWQLALEVRRWVVDHRYAMRAEHAHECDKRHARELGALPMPTR
jgi:hypothetical protein